MRILRALTFLVSLTAGWTSGAFAGAGTLTASVTPLGDGNVTYSITSPAMDTYVGYTIAFGNTGGNTINNISFTVTATATDSAEVVKLFINNPTVVLPNGCAQASDSAFTCTVGQLQAGAAFPTFQVFFKAPAKNVNGNADVDGTDFINVNMHVLYAERLGGPTSPPQNSVQDENATPVLLGTANPDRIKSGVPKSGASLYTGRPAFRLRATSQPCWRRFPH